MKKSLLLFTMMLLGMVYLQAAYMKNVPVTRTQPDGKIINCFASGDEYYNYLHDADGFTIVQNVETGYYVYADKSGDDLIPTALIAGEANPAEAGLTPYINISGEKWLEKRNKWLEKVPQRIDMGKSDRNHGTLNNLVSFITFSDDSEFTTPFSNFDNMFNASSSGANSMNNYFKTASYNQLNVPSTFYPAPNGNNVVSYHDSHPRGYYRPYSATNPNGYNGDEEMTARGQELIANAATYISSMVPASLNIDFNNDNIVDNICFIVKGQSDGWNDFLWPHKWNLFYYDVYINNKKVDVYNLQLETFGNPSTPLTNGTLCHEMFHALGAPDLYHYSEQNLAPAAYWDLMEYTADPPQHMGAYMKMKYGTWISNIPEITSPGTYTLNPLASSGSEGTCYKIATGVANQYYVVEYRNTTMPFESGLPGSGLLIYRINTSFEGNAQYNGTTVFDEVYIFRPNGTTTANGNPEMAFFSSGAGRTSFNSSSNPHPFLTDGSSNGLDISNIGAAGNTIQFTVNNIGGSGPAGSCDPPYNVSNTVNGYNVNLTWTEPAKNEGSKEEVWISHSTGNFYDGYGFTEAYTSYSYAQRFTPAFLAPYAGGSIKKMTAAISAEMTNCTFRVWTGTVNNLTLIHEQPVIVDPYVYTEVELTTPIPITGTNEIWIGYSTNMVPPNTFFMGVDSGPYVANANYVIDGNDCYELKEGLNIEYNLIIAGLVETSVTPPPSTEAYNIYRNGQKIASNVSGTSYSDNGLTDGQYCYTLKTICTDGESPASNSSCATVGNGGGGGCDAPILTVSPGTGTQPSIVLQWTAVSGASQYTVYFMGTAIGTTENTYVELSGQGIEANIEYCFTVSATCASGESPQSNQGCATYTGGGGGGGCDAPVITASPGTGTQPSIVLQWAAISGAYQYTVYVQGNPLGNVQNNIVEIPGIEANVEYCFTVTATCSSGESPHSNQACATYGGGGGGGAVPILSVAGSSLTESCIQLHWTPVLGASSYTVYSGNMPITTVNTTSTCIQALPNVNYCFTVTATGFSGESAHSNEVCTGVDLDEFEDKIDLKVYPNPANDILNVEGNGIRSVEIYNYMGQRCDVIDTAGKLDINTTTYKSGVYFVKIITKDGTSVTQKVIIVH